MFKTRICSGVRDMVKGSGGSRFVVFEIFQDYGRHYFSLLGNFFAKFKLSYD